MTGFLEVEIFLTSEHKIIANRQLAIDHMVKEEYRGEEIAKMQTGLKRCFCSVLIGIGPAVHKKHSDTKVPCI